MMFKGKRTTFHTAIYSSLSWSGSVLGGGTPKYVYKG